MHQTHATPSSVAIQGDAQLRHVDREKACLQRDADLTEQMRAAAAEKTAQRAAITLANHRRADRSRKAALLSYRRSIAAIAHRDGFHAEARLLLAKLPPALTRRPARPRGAGRPAGRATTRSSARSGDSGSDSDSDEPALGGLPIWTTA